MIKEIEIDGKNIEIEIIIPEEVKKFLEKNKINENRILENPLWEEGHTYEDYDENGVEDGILGKNLKKAKVIINYIHITNENQIRVPPENFSNGKVMKTANISKGDFAPFTEFSIGYVVFDK